MNSKAMWVIVILVMVGTVGLIIWAANQSSNPTTRHLSQPVGETDWRAGKLDAKVVLVEYGDFQCPACAQYYPIVKQVLDNYKDKIVFSFRHFPLSQHPNAKPAAYAAEAAGQQGKFWEMYDLLYANQTAWANLPDAASLFDSYAATLQLNLDQFKKDVAGDAVRQKVDAGYQSGLDSGVSATPTFFLNNTAIFPRDYNEFKGALDAALKQ